MEQNQEKITWSELLATVAQRTRRFELIGLNKSAQAFAISQIYQKHRLPMLIIESTVKETELLVEQLSFFLQGEGADVHAFPSYNLTPYRFMAYHSETAARRIRTLYHLLEGQVPPIVVASTSALMQQIVPAKELTQYTELLMVGEELDRDLLLRKLTAGGYSRTVLTEEPGDYSLRGGILDIFTPLYSDPVRIEFFGDLIETIRLFSPDTQRTHTDLTELIVLPAKEAIIRSSQLNTIVGRVRKAAADLELPVTQVREIVGKIKDQGGLSGLESLLPFVYDSLDSLIDYLPKSSLIIRVEPTDLQAIADETTVQIGEAYQTSLDRQRLCLPPEKLFFDWSQLTEKILEFNPLSIKGLNINPVSPESETPVSTCLTNMTDITHITQNIQSAAGTDNPFESLIRWLVERRASGETTHIACRKPSQIERLAQTLESHNLFPVRIDRYGQALNRPGGIYFINGNVGEGFVWPEAKTALINDEEIFGVHYQARRSRARTALSELMNIEDLKQGDFVVHDEHGIGRYEGLTKMTIDRSVNDFLIIVYRDEDKLYLPVERMNLVQKYMGTEGISPALDKMGGVTWEKVKNSVKRSTEKMAGELLQLFAARKVQKGHAFGSVDTYFRDFEDGFPFDETPDQSKAIADVMHDMHQPTPMDRLICGDVGYGKTEVALRAAFLAISEAKQVAVLVPTTVLAEQHFNTFSERFKKYPVKVAALSRFRPPKEQRQIVTELKEGKIDIIIGTHRLLQKDVEFSNLGLLVLDEEQRFGVRHKEKIKQFRKTVDVLTLTATPIPRTLHLSLTGIRDISLISTPPEQRRPITTYISEFEDSLVADAIRKELKRNGQIFFVHNKVKGIDSIAKRLKTLVPEVKLAVAHGQMGEEQLEKIMLDFMHRRIDMLVCTTIIESGLDVTAANTILINRADLFGLSQIYQLRGRVGRGDEQAYAYLFIPDEALVSKDARKRLKVLMEYSDLGSGFQIAMSDLKIRGGGTILGASQSGHIASVGYDMFLKLMETSIAELKGEVVVEELEPEINLPLDAFLPEQYVSDIDQRLSLYRRLARMTDLKAISTLKDEMTDRFGKVPKEVNNLLLKIMLKVLATKAGCKRLDLNDNILQMYFSEQHQNNPMGLIQIVDRQKSKYHWTVDRMLRMNLQPGSPTAQIAQIKNTLIEIARRVNQ